MCGLLILNILYTISPPPPLFLQVCERTISPQWHEAFHFLVQDPNKDILVIKVRIYSYLIINNAFDGDFTVCSLFSTQLSSGWDQPMGSLVLPIRELLSQPELMLDKWLSLDGALAESQILLRAELKV